MLNVVSKICKYQNGIAVVQAFIVNQNGTFIKFAVIASVPLGHAWNIGLKKAVRAVAVS